MFGTTNSIEPVRGEVDVVEARAARRPTARAAEDGPPIREATPADLASAARRQRATATPEPDPVRAVSEARGFFRRRPAEEPQADSVSQRHGLYVTEKRGTRTYYEDYQQKREVMRAEAKRITTKQDDRRTVTAVLDLAEARGWQTVRLRGTEDFKREAWVQAQVRGIATEGYKATATDTQEVARRRAAMTPADGQGERAAPQAPASAAPQEAATVAPKATTESRAVQVPIASGLAPAMPMQSARAAPADAAAPQPAPRVTSDELAAARAAGSGRVEHSSTPGSELPPQEQVSARPVQQLLSDAEVKQITSDEMTRARVWKIIKDPNADPAGVREALERAPQADRARLTAEVMEGLEHRAAKTGSRDELNRIAPHLPGSVAEYAARVAAMTPEQANAISRAALGSLHPSRAAEYAAKVDKVEKLSADARQKAVWGSVEEAGRTSRAAEAAQAVKATAGERRSAAETV